MFYFYGAVIGSVGITCLFLSQGATSVAQDVSLETRTVAECIVAANITNDEMAMIATYFNVPGYLVVDNGNTPGLQLVSETNDILVIGDSMFSGQATKYFGQTMHFGEEIRSGLVWNSSSEEILFEVPKTGDIYTLFAGEMLVVGNYLKQENQNKKYHILRAGTSCSVTCKDGYYACCNKGNSAYCRCVSNTILDASCQTGGLGTASCSISVTTNP
jgi:hypothetical protein